MTHERNHPWLDFYMNLLDQLPRNRLLSFAVARVKPPFSHQDCSCSPCSCTMVSSLHARGHSCPRRGNEQIVPRCSELRLLHSCLWMLGCRTCCSRTPASWSYVDLSGLSEPCRGVLWRDQGHLQSRIRGNRVPSCFHFRHHSS